MIRQKIRQWFYERFDVEGLKKPIDYQLRKPLPRHISWFHTLGSMSLFLFVSQVLTGMLLLFNSRPAGGGGWEGVKYIMAGANKGWLMREFHAWGANLMIAI